MADHVEGRCPFTCVALWFTGIHCIRYRINDIVFSTLTIRRNFVLVIRSTARDAQGCSRSRNDRSKVLRNPRRRADEQ